MKKLFAIIAFLLVAALSSHAQANQPDCQIGPVTASVAQRTVFDNRFFACTNWTLYAFGNSSLSVLSIELDQAPDIGGSAGTWAIWPSTDVGPSSVMPLTSLTFDQAQAYEFAPWVSVNATTVTGGSVTYIAMGYRQRGNGFDAGGPPVTPLFNGSLYTPQNTCPTSVPITLGAAGTLQIVAPVAGKKVYVCTFFVVESVAGTIQLTEGTGATCGTGTTNVTGAISGTVGTPMGVAGISSTFQTNVAGDGLCLVNGAATVDAGFASIAQY